MDFKVTTLDGKSAGKIAVSEEVFGLEPRADILQRMVRYQLLKRQQGTHNAKKRSDITGSTAKIYRQKGTGNARHGSRKPGIFKGGGKTFGPIARSHAIDLPKKVRALALRHALSAKAKTDAIMVLDDAAADAPKTKALLAKFAGLGLSNALIIDGSEIDGNFSKAASNIPMIDVLPVQGINVYDILRRDTLVLTKAAIAALEARFK
jgi:large subunit ribosomal protein L4